MPTTLRTPRKLALALTAGALVLTACGGGAVSDDKTSNPPAAATGTGGAAGSDAPAASTLTADCTDYQPTQGIEDGTIKIGYSGPMSGPFASIGVGVQGTLGYFEMINQAGGVEAADGKKYKLELISKDDQYTAATAKTNVQTLIDSDGVFALLGVVGTSANLAIRPLVSEKCVPDLYATAGAPELGNPDYPWQINGPVSIYSSEGRLYAEYLKKNMPDATIAVMYQNDDYGAAEIQSLRKGVEGSNLKIVKEVTFETTDPDLSNQITTLAATKADVVVSIALGTQSLLAINTIYANSEWKPQVISAPLSIAQLKMLNPGAGDGMLTGGGVDIDSPEFADTEAVKLFREWVQPQFDKNAINLPLSLALGGWNQADLLVQTIEQATSLDRAAVMERARDITPDLSKQIMIKGVVLETSPGDTYILEGMEIVRYDADTQTVESLETYDLNGEVPYEPVVR